MAGAHFGFCPASAICVGDLRSYWPEQCRRNESLNRRTNWC